MRMRMWRRWLRGGSTLGFAQAVAGSAAPLLPALVLARDGMRLHRILGSSDGG